MRTIVKASLVVTALMLLSACTAPLSAPGGGSTADSGSSVVQYPNARPVAAKFKQVDIDSDRPFTDYFDSVGEAIWTSPTTFTVLTSGGGNCFNQPSTIVAPDAMSIEVVYEFVGGPACTMDARLYLHEIEVPEGITGNTPVELTMTFPALNENTDERVEVTTIQVA